MIPKSIKLTISWDLIDAMEKIEATARFDTAISKNRKYIKRDSKILHPDYVRAKLDITHMVRMKAHNKRFRDKVDCTLILNIYAKNKRMDPMNCLEGIFDAIEDGLKLAGCPVNDRYFADCHFTRTVDKENPRIEIILYQ